MSLFLSSDFYDRVLFITTCVVIVILPVSSAMVETGSFLMLLAYLGKRIALLDFSRLFSGKKKARNLGKVLLPVPTPLDGPLMVYALVAVVSVALSEYKALGAGALFTKLFQQLLVFYTVREALSRPERVWIFLICAAGSLCVVSLDGLYQFWSGTDLIRGISSVQGRTSATFKHPNDFATYLVSLLPVVILTGWLGTFFPGADRISSGKKEIDLSPGRLRMPARFAAVIGSLVLILTYSRVAWMCLFAGGIIIFHNSWKRLAVSLTVVSVLIAVGVVTISSVREVDVANPRGIISFSSRDIYWESAWKIIQENFWHGVGYNAYSRWAGDSELDLRWRGYPHNCFLQIWAETGVFGLAAFLWFLIRLFGQAVRCLRAPPPGGSYSVCLGLTAGLTAFLFYVLLDTALYSTQLSALFWILAGSLVAVSDPKSSFQNWLDSNAAWIRAESVPPENAAGKN